ncbi:4'-phosphopantetheinyl transferase family protein [Riemerella anatipestifer]|uniref:4'-phosphopantetheinyl transferase family protein n=1 Tax=Riemerella anatipestifer TaxID=34085 RepID=UPI00129DB117|nr:4'-phosphopantetheinyl transferase family protein [Riemerella anatipestifer]MRM84088.1 4'-phosphopantetheinyl transferase [Riemerella anatipestifer]
MPLYKEFSTKEIAILVWKHDEQKEVWHEEIDTQSKISIKKQYERLMVRRMLNSALPLHQLFYLEDGTPYLEPSSAFISISHSYPYAVLAIAPRKIGVDIEKKSDKLVRLKEKILYPSEKLWVSSQDEESYLTALWTIKESLYKIHSAKYWSFREHYEVLPFSLDNLSSVECKVLNSLTGNADIYRAKLEIIGEDYYLAVAEEA